MQPALENRLNKLLRLSLLFIVIALAFSLFRSYNTHRRAQGRLAEAQSKLEREREEKETLARELEKTASIEYKEKQARDKLGLVRRGETILVLPDDEILRKLAPKGNEEENFTFPEPNWKKWLELFL